MANNKQKFVAMSKVTNGNNRKDIDFLMKLGEEVVLTFNSVRDQVFFTNKKVVTLDVQGLTGKKVEYMCIPYSKITAISAETNGSFDLDSELKIWTSGLGLFGIEFIRGTDVKEIIKLVNDNIEY